MSRELIHQVFVKLGFTETEANVYVQLTTNGPQSPSDLTKALKMHTRQICSTLKKLESKGVIKATYRCQASFSAVPFEQVLDLLIKNNIEQAKFVMQNKKDLLYSWKSMINEDTSNS